MYTHSKQHIADIDNLTFFDLFDTQEVQKMQDLFAHATGVATIITQIDGTPITTPTNFCRLCKDVIRKTEIGICNCKLSDAQMGKPNTNGPIIQPCLSAGLLDAGVSIVVEGKHIANWLIGQVRTEIMDEFAVSNYSEQIGSDKEEFQRALNEVPFMSIDRFEQIANMLFVFANQLADKAQNNYLLKKRLVDERAYNEELSVQKELLAITLNSIGDAVITTDKDGLIVRMNQVAEKLCGWKFDDAQGKHLTDVFHIVEVETRKLLKNPIQTVLESGRCAVLATDAILISKGGEEFFIADNAAPITDKSGNMSGVVLVFSDISEKYLITDNIKKSEKRYRKLLEDLDAGVVLHASDSSILLANPKANELLGLSNEQLFGKKSIDPCWCFLSESGSVMDPDDYPVNIISRNKLPLYNMTLGVVRETDDVVWLLLNGSPMLDAAGEVTEVIISFIDITTKKKTEDDLKKNEKYLNDTQAIARLGSFTLDFGSNQWTSTLILDDIFGIDSDFDKSYQNWMAIIHPDWQLEISSQLKNELTQNSLKFDKEYKIVRRNNQEERWVHCIAEFVFDAQQKPLKMIGVIQDIQERVMAEDSLRISERKYREIFDNVQDVYFQIDLDGIVREISPSIQYFTDFDRNDIIDTHVLNLYNNPIDRENLLKNIYLKGELRDYEIDFVSKGGNVLNSSLNARLIRDLNGNPKHIDGTIRDITKRKVAEKRLRDSERKFHDYLTFAPHGIFVTNDQEEFIEVNPAASKITGYTEAELLDLNPANLMHADSVGKFYHHLRSVVHSGYESDEFVIVKKTGEKCYVNADTVQFDASKYLTYVVDITKRKIAEEALVTSEKFLRETQIISQMGTFKFDFITGRAEFSDIFKAIMGIDADFGNLIEKVIDIVKPEYRASTIDYFQRQVVDNKAKFDKKIKIFRVDDSAELWIHVLAEPVLDANNQLIALIGTVQDITKRKNLAEALRKSESLYRSILNASPDAIVVTDLNGDISMVSPAAKSMYGVSVDAQIIGKNIFSFVHESDRSRARVNCELMFEEFLGTCEYKILSVAGNSFYAEVNGDVIWGSDGLPTGIVFSVRDISERKVSEMALKDSQLQIKQFAAHLQSVREEEKIMLAREIHDELGQFLIALKIDVGLLKQNVLKCIKSNESEDILSKFDNVFGIVDNTIKTTRKIMTDLRPEVLYMVGFIDAIKFYSSKYEERNNIQCIIHSVDKVELEQEQSIALFRIFQEALTNVLKHSKATCVTIHLKIKQSKLIFEISDNGIGFKKNQKPKMDSYGLIGMQERVYLLEGEFQILGKPGQGTTIRIEMPYCK